MGRAVFPPSYLTWGRTNEDKGDLLQQVHSCTAALSAPNPVAGHRWPKPLQRLLDTHGQVWLSLLWGHCSFRLGPGAHKVLFVLSKSVFPSPV